MDQKALSAGTNSSVADTAFLNDPLKDRRGRGPLTGATAFLRRHTEIALDLPIIAKGEYLKGFQNGQIGQFTRWKMGWMTCRA